jgi:hypothetical protein
MDRSLRLAAASVATGLVAILVGISGCAAPAGAPGEATPTPSTAPAATPAEALSNLPAVITPLVLDTPTTYCVAIERFAVFRLAGSVTTSTGDAYHSLFPDARLTPELDTAHGDTIVVVYRGGWPGPYFIVPGSQTEGRRSPDPGTWDVCLEASDNSLGQPYIVYANVSSAGSPVAATAR